MGKIPVALQIYTVREEAKKDFVGTLKKVAEIGYAGVELTSYGPLSAEELKKLLDDLNLKPAGSHVPLNLLEGEIERAIDFTLEIGSSFITCPFIPEDKRPDEAGYRKVAEVLNSAGAQCKKQGIQLCYHNHSFEFVKFGGKYALDILYEATDPSLVQAEIDTYWIQHGGEDPVEYIKRYSGRAPLIHLKDMTDDEERTFAEVGTGLLDFDGIYEASEAGGAKWYIVEQDRCKGSPFDSARISFENIKAKGRA